MLTETGMKFDTNKPAFDLLPDDALAEIQKVLDFGAKKYAARNWEKGLEWRRVWNATMRHLWAWVRREDKDPETGLSPLAHAACEILFLLAFELRGAGVDDRHEAPPSKVGAVGVTGTIKVSGSPSIVGPTPTTGGTSSPKSGLSSLFGGKE